MAIETKVPGTIALKVSATGNTTIVKEIKVGTPIRRMVGATNTVDNLGGLDNTNKFHNQGIFVYDSASGNYVATKVLGTPDSGTYGSTSTIPVLTVNRFGVIDSAGSVSISTDLDFSGDTGSGTINLATETLTFSSGPRLSTAVTGNDVRISLDSSGVLAGSYGSGSQIPIFSVNAEGLIDSVSTRAVAGVTNLTFDSATRNLTILTADGDSHTAMISTVNGESGTYGSASLIPVLTVNKYGEVDSIGEVSVAGVSSVTFDSASKLLTINTADGNTFPTMIHSVDADSGTYGSASGIPIITVNKYGLIDSVGLASVGGITNTEFDSANRVFQIATSDGTLHRTHIAAPIMQIAGDAGTDNHHIGDSAPLTVTGGTGVSTQINDNEVVFNIGQSVNTTDSVTFSGVHVTGDLVVSGTQTTFNTNSLVIQDPLIHLADSNMDDVLDIGFMGHYYQDGQFRKTGLFRDASNERYYLFSNMVDSAFDSSPAPATISRYSNEFVTAHMHVGRLTIDSAYNGVYTSGHLDLQEKGRLRFAKVLELFYDGTEKQSSIRDSSEKGLKITGHNLTLRRAGDDEPFAVFRGDSATSLYYNGVKRFTTTPYGSRIVGIALADSVQADFLTGVYRGFDSDLTQKTTDDLAEGSNLYFTDERVDDRINNLFVAGRGLTKSYDDSANTYGLDADLATNDSLGVAMFDSADFTMNMGLVSISNTITLDAGTF